MHIPINIIISLNILSRSRPEEASKLISQWIEPFPQLVVRNSSTQTDRFIHRAVRVSVFVFQHVDVAALLIKYDACVNATDKWALTPLHEAAQKGQTQLCALLLAHGTNPTLRNQEGQTPLDLVTVCVTLP